MKIKNNLLQLIALTSVNTFLCSCAEFEPLSTSSPSTDEIPSLNQNVTNEISLITNDVVINVSDEFINDPKNDAESLNKETLSTNTSGMNRVDSDAEFVEKEAVNELNVSDEDYVPISDSVDVDVDVDVVVNDGSKEAWRLQPETETQQQSVASLCQEIGNKLGSVNVDDCFSQNLKFGGAYTLHNRPIAVRDFIPEGEIESKTKILIMGGIHGDEYSSISIIFKWMALLNATPTSSLLWRFVPTVNPDGLLDGKAVRQNANGVDLNRNFPSQDWNAKAQRYWVDSTGRNPRRYPGEQAASEIEVQWVVDQIETFKPDVIMSVHAPYHLLDFDGPSEAPEKIGELYLHVLGVYPGSLGNYAGVDLEIPVVTLELPAAGIMPTEEQVVAMWSDIQNWLHEIPLE